MDLNDSLALRFLGTLLVRLACTIAVAMGSPVLADEGSQMPRGVPPAYLEECAACHRNAERSIFDEDDLIRPKGALLFRQRIDSR